MSHITHNQDICPQLLNSMTQSLSLIIYLHRYLKYIYPISLLTGVNSVRQSLSLIIYIHPYPKYIYPTSLLNSRIMIAILLSFTQLVFIAHPVIDS